MIYSIFLLMLPERNWVFLCICVLITMSWNWQHAEHLNTPTLRQEWLNITCPPSDNVSQGNK